MEGALRRTTHCFKLITEQEPPPRSRCPVPRTALQSIFSTSVGPQSLTSSLVCLSLVCVLAQVSTKPVRVNRHVLERQSWEKFGDCKGVPRGPEQNITYQSFEIIHLDLRPKKREEEKDDGALESKLSGTSSIVVCRNWSVRTPQPRLRLRFDARSNRCFDSHALLLCVVFLQR